MVGLSKENLMNQRNGILSFRIRSMVFYATQYVNVLDQQRFCTSLVLTRKKNLPKPREFLSRYSFLPMPIWKSFSVMIRWEIISMRREVEICLKSPMSVAPTSEVGGWDYFYTSGRIRSLFCPYRLNYWRRTSHTEDFRNALIRRCDPIHGPLRLKLSCERSFGLEEGYKTPASDG